MIIKSAAKNIFLFIFLFAYTANLQAQVIAIDDVDSTNEDVALIIDVQLNDINLGAGSLYTILLTSPANGTTTLLSVDSVLYTPFLNFYGIDTFTYEVYNEDEIPSSGTAQVVITVLPQPDFPIANNDFDTTSVEVPKIADVQGNDINFDPEFLVTSIVSAPANGTAEVIGGVSVLYTPADDYFGNDSFTYSVCNPSTIGFCDTATVYMFIKEINLFHPELVDDFAVQETGVSQTIYVLANDTDGDGDVLFVADAFAGSTVTGSFFLNPDYSITYSSTTETIDTLLYIGCDINSPSYCDTAMLVVTVTNPAASGLTIPNSFSPNEDGFHDYFIIDGLNQLASFNLKIFNRWGDIVFETADANVLWDGTSNVSSLLPTGRLPEGTYFYILQTSEADSYKGFIEMRR